MLIEADFVINNVKMGREVLDHNFLSKITYTFKLMISLQKVWNITYKWQFQGKKTHIYTYMCDYEKFTKSKKATK
jgi:hypothetical protein